jgi:hypothetical protein
MIKMAEAKKSGKRIDDVARPGKSAPSGTSKAVIVTNRPIMKDPMVTEPAAEKVTETPAAPPKPAGHVTIQLQPLTAPLLENTKAKPAEEPAEDAKIEEPVKAEEPATEAKVEPKTEPEIKPKVETKLEPIEKSKPEPAKAPEPAQEEAAEEAKPDKSTEPAEESAPQETTEPAETAEGKATPAEIDAEAEAKQAEHDAAIQKLIDSKQYFLPINSVEKRRTKRVIVLGVALSLLLIIAWADVALDAGLVQIDGIKPVTHFFSN